MNRFVYFTLVLVFFYSWTNTTTDNRVAFISDNPADRVVWERMSLADPNTGRIPRNIRQKEMIFAKTLPKASVFSKANWIHRGPYNVGGRTRALAMDVLDENILLARGLLVEGYL